MMSEPQGPVYMCYDSAMQEAQLKEEVACAELRGQSAFPVLRPSARSLNKQPTCWWPPTIPLAHRNMPPAHAAGFRSTVELAETVGASVFDINKRLGFPNRHPLSVSFHRDAFKASIWSPRWTSSTGRAVPTSSTLRPAKSGSDCARLQMDRCRLCRYRDQQVGHRLQQASQLGSSRVLGDSALSMPALTAACQKRIDGNKAVAAEPSAKKPSAKDTPASGKSGRTGEGTMERTADDRIASGP